jgi:hypothetical protein
MIDTIIINIPKKKMRKLKPEKWDMVASGSAYKKFVKNPTREQKDDNEKYYPRLTGINRGYSEPMVKIEFSVPKLIFLNNLDELAEKDFKRVVDTLHDRLIEMDVFIEKKDLIHSEVSSIHFGKNIVLKEYSSNYVISQLEKVNLNKQMDLTKIRFMNSGESLQGYSNSNSFVFYDKISDLNKDKKRAIDKDQTAYQKNLFEPLKQVKNRLEVLRFEVRLSHKRKMKTLFKKVGFEQKNYTFQEVFSEELAVKVLADYWQSKIDDNRYVLFTLNEPAEKILSRIATVRPKAKAKTLITLSGLIYLAKNTSGGLREIRKVISRRVNDRTWYRLVSDLKAISNDLRGMSELDWYTEVSEQIINYKPYKITKNS